MELLNYFAFEWIQFWKKKRNVGDSQNAKI